MGRCQYHEICGLEGEYSSGKESLCILHSPKKDAELFWKAFEEYRKRSNSPNFHAFIFPANTSFSDDKFHTVATFTKTRFLGGAFFDDTEFSKGATFDDAIFFGSSDFSNAKFLQEVSFKGVQFDKFIAFMNVTFAEKANFDTTRFRSNVSFAGSSFAKSRFTGAEFLNIVSFDEVVFKHAPRFGGCTFKERADFSYCELLEGLELSGITFCKRTTFRSAKFGNTTKFGNVKFEEDADFVNASFDKRVDFSATTFKGQVDFTYASFQDEVNLSKCIFFEHAFFIGDSANPIFKGIKVDFRTTIMHQPNAIVFRYADLTQCQILNTDLRSAELTDVLWRTIDKRNCVYDEIADTNNAKASLPFGQIERLYRELKQNYEDRRDFERAGDFHVGEKEMRRKDPKTAFGLRAMLSVYKLIGGYGEYIVNPLNCLVFLLFGCTGLYLLFGLCFSDSSCEMSLSRVRDWTRALRYSLQVMTLNKPIQFEPCSEGSAWVQTIESLLGPLFIALLALAIRQRLRR